MTQFPRQPNQRVLVAYASEFGSTAAVAAVIGQVIREAGVEVDVRSVVDVQHMSTYQAAVVGSAIYNGQWLPEAVHFVRHHAAELSLIPTAYFVVCATMSEASDERRRGAHSFVDAVLETGPAL